DTLAVSQPTGALTVESASHRLELRRALDSFSDATFTTEVVVDACEGARSLCGAYEIPARLALRAGGDEALLESGDTLAVGAATVTVGRVGWVVAAPASCDASRRTAGLRHDLAITR